MHELIAVGEERLAQRLEYSRLVAAEMVGKDQIRAARVSASF